MSLKFVNLHGHTTFSVYDAIGFPEDHVKWMLANAGEDSGALAITDHGSMNGIGYVAAAQKKYKDKAKIIYGTEAYYVPSLAEWTAAYEEDRLRKEAEKKQKKKKTGPAQQLVVEDEKESRLRFYNPLGRRHHMVLLAHNQKGLENLFRLTSRSYREGFYRKPRLDFELLRELNEGIIVSTACLAGLPAWCSFHPDAEEDADFRIKLYEKELRPLMEVFGKDRFFLEMQFHDIEEQKIVNRHVMDFSERTGYDLVVTCDSHYPRPEMWVDREIHKFLGYQTTGQQIDLSSLERSESELDAHLYLKNGDQIWGAYKKNQDNLDENLVKAAIERTYNLAHDYIEDVHPNQQIKLPRTFQVTEDIKTPFDKLKQLCLEALEKKDLLKDEYVSRAIHELQVIKALGVSEYFLAKAHSLNSIRNFMLTGPGRGSGAGSLVCYLLDITFLDPVKFGLLFERFLSLSRKGLPDVDSDVSRKDWALDTLKDEFGEENVVAVNNYNTLQLKSLVKDVSRLYGVPFKEVNAVTKIMESEAKDSLMAECGYDQKLYSFTLDGAKRFSPTFRAFLKKHPSVAEHVENLFGQIKSISRHAGGTLIVPGAEAHIPIMKIRGMEQCPIQEGLTVQHLEQFGLVKFDFLGLATLRIIERCIEIILQGWGVDNPDANDTWEFYKEFLHPDVMNLEDQSIFEKVYHEGQFPSIFQFSEKAVQGFCKRAEPKSLMDIAAITALWRPGPLKGGADIRYLGALERGADKDEHPVIKEVLGETMGLLLYQEQFMLLANKLAGFTLEESDRLRKLLVKPAKDLAAEMIKERAEAGKKFVQGCIDKGVTPARAKTLWEKEILGFISYGFNKSHAVAYAFNSYHCSWLYTYYEKEWIQACFECDPSLEETIITARTLGYNIKKPDVNQAKAEEWKINEDKTCIPALTSLKGVGITAAEELVTRRPKEGFKDLEEFLYNTNKEGERFWRWSKLNKKTLAVLFKMDALDCLDAVGPDKTFKTYKHLHDALFPESDKTFFKKIRDGKVTLEEAAFHRSGEDWTTTERIAFQREIVGFYDKALLLGELLEVLDEFGIYALDELADEKNKTKAWGVVEKVVQKTTAKKKPYLVVSASGLTEKMYSFKVWDTSVKKNSVWTPGYVLVFGLDYSKDYGYSLSRRNNPIRITK